MSNTIPRTIHLKWDEQISYSFCAHHIISKEGSTKTIYLGYFTDAAPPSLQPGQQYCVKEIDLVQDRYIKYPQLREYFDLLEMYGQHQRQILARNPKALEVAEAIRKTGTYGSACTCIVVEPIYQSCAGLSQNCWQLPVEKRIDIIMQYVQGCIELQDDKNRINGKQIVAHRDLKFENGVEDNQFCIRIIDYASIRLVDDQVSQNLPQENNENGTATMPLSVVNTAPEDVIQDSTFVVTEKTDVYALGMMLASLFITIDNQHKNSNPNLVWAFDHGWVKNNAEQCKNNMVAAFREAMDAYANSSWNNTWIEQALKACHHNVYWEPTASTDIQQAIRKLFFQATHISPADRISLQEFYDNLKAIKEQATACTARFPVSVYLFDCTNLPSYKYAYLTAASNVFSKQCAEARMSSQPSPLVLCVSYGRPAPGQKPMEKLIPPNSFPHLRKEDLSAYINGLQPLNGSGQDPLIYAIAVAGQYLSKYKDRFFFNGCIHLFTPAVPRYQEIIPFPVNGTPCNLVQFCRILANDLERMPTVCIHAPNNNEQYSEDSDWYSFEALPTQAWTSSYSPSQPPVTPHPTYPHVPEAAPAKENTPPKPEDQFYTDAEASFFLTPDGRKIYIGLK